MVDFMYMGRLMLHPDGLVKSPAFQNAGGQPLLNNSNLYYDGNSQGGIFGGTLTAVSPDFTHAVLNTTGINYSLLVPRSVDAYAVLAAQNNSYTDRLTQSLLDSLLEVLLQRSDPVGYAAHMTDDPYPNTPAHTVFLQVAVGDHQVTNWASLTEARSIGAKLRTPAVNPGRLPGPDPLWGLEPVPNFPYSESAIAIWDSGPIRTVDGDTEGTAPPPVANVADADGDDPHDLLSATPLARSQVAAFLQPDGKIIDPCGSHPCYHAGYGGP